MNTSRNCNTLQRGARLARQWRRSGRAMFAASCHAGRPGSAEEICCVGGRLALEERRVLVEGAKTLRVTRFSPLECRQNEWMIVAASDAGFTGMPTKGILPARLVPIYISGLLKRVVRSSLAAEVSHAADLDLAVTT
ncbi:unnamed protein product [Durusdinium trenchii]|uniref:Uncharacterized protein n=1 Tax=Durusdinium trenchii TaxID=1381693 RepID=A0ABP0P6U1_9DINO